MKLPPFLTGAAGCTALVVAGQYWVAALPLLVGFLILVTSAELDQRRSAEHARNWLARTLGAVATAERVAAGKVIDMASRRRQPAETIEEVAS